MVAECTEAALRGAMAGGGYVTFDCDGTITLSTTLSVDASLVLDSTGHHVTLSGGGANRVLAVERGVTLTLSNLTIAGGYSQDGSGGGGVYNDGTLNVLACTFQGNTVVGSNAAPVWQPGFPGNGGAIYNSATGLLSVDGCTFWNNSATGGSGMNGYAGAIMGMGGPSIDGGPGSSGGAASGGAIYNAGTARIVNGTFASNSVTGGSGGDGGAPGYGVIETSRGPDVVYGTPGAPGQGGAATAAAVYDASANCAMTNCTLAFNTATGGVGGSFLSFPIAPGPSGGAAGCVSGATLVNCLLAGNTAADTFTDGGHNVRSATANGVVGPLADNGGPTLTVALPDGSPAIDAADNLAAPPTDQRGIPRFYGAACDAGAFESQGSIWLQASLGAAGAVELRVNGSAAQVFRLLASTNLADWTPLQTNQLGLDQFMIFEEPAGNERGFYRVEMLLGAGGYTVETLAAPIVGGSVFGGGGFLDGYNVTVLATPNPGYVFLDWTENGAAVSASTNYSFTAAANRTLTADFAALCMIAVAASPAAGGSVTGGGVFVAGSNVTVQATTNSGYVFVGWEVNGALVTNSSSYTFTATGNATVTAEFASFCVVTVSASPALDGSASGGGSFPPGSGVTLTATPSAGFGFVNWTENGSPVSASSNYTFTVSADRTLVANYAPLYSVAASASPAQGGSATGGGVFLSGTSVTVVAATNSGYAFVNWADNGLPVSASASYTFAVTTNRALTANFAPLYTIAASASPGAGGSASGGTFAGGSIATVAAVPAGGYAFVNWTENGLPVSASPRYTFEVAGNRALTANFAPACTVSLSAAPPQGGSVTGWGVFPVGAALTVTATPTPGYAFTNWTENGLPISASANYSFPLAASRRLTANFTPLYPAQVVSECTEAALRGAVAQGGMVSFACDGTIVLSNAIVVSSNTVLDGTGHEVAIAGSGQLGAPASSQGFYVNSNVTFTAINLTLTNCTGAIDQASMRPGGAIVNDGGNLTLSSVSFLANRAILGGAIHNTNGGTVSAFNCAFADNVTLGDSADSVTNGRGGAICSYSGVVNLRYCTFRHNTAQGSSGGTSWLTPSPGLGGAIYNGGRMTIGACAFQGNAGAGASIIMGGTAGGSAMGGAIWNGGTLAISGSAFLTNSVSGGNGGIGQGGEPGMPGYPGYDGGSGLGGALYNAGTASLVNSTFYGNTASGGQGGRGGDGGLIDPWTHGASGPDGSVGFSVGAISSEGGSLSLTNCTLAFNSATTGLGGLDGGTVLANTLLATNGGNGIPGFVDAGHNLSSDASCQFTDLTSFNNTDPRLAPPSDNGGPTPTMALLPGSPAIDAGDTLSAPPTDQRGFPRPYGAAADIGAYEAMPLYAVSASAAPAQGGSVSGGGMFGSGATVMLLATASPAHAFVSWTENGTLVSTNPAYAFIATAGRTLTANFAPLYRVALLVLPAAGGAVSGGGAFLSGADVTVQATSNPGCQFVAWTENGQVVSTSPSYSFTVDADRTLGACFAPYPFVPPKGTYAALFYDATNGVAPQSCGLLSFTIGARGAYSGNLQLAGTKYRLSGRFDGSGKAAGVIARQGLPSLTARLDLDLLSGGARVAGTVSNGTWTAAFAADRACFDARANPAPQRGSYTLALSGVHGSANQAAGDGYGTLTVSPSGLVSLRGALADGTVITPSAQVSGTGQWPLYAALDGGKGVVWGWLSFTNATDLGGAVAWVKPASKSGCYRSGFSFTAPVLGARYVAPGSGTNVLGLALSTTLTLELQGGALTHDIISLLTLSANDRVSVLSGPKPSLTFTPTTGAFSGSVVDPVSSRPVFFSGVVLQGRRAGSGFFLSAGQSGQVSLAP